MSYKPGLYVVSTPIGNLKDITLRAIEVLQNSTLILCEDTRRAFILLKKYDINYKKLIVYNDYSSSQTRECIRKFIMDGEVISLITDAGTPLIADPGYKLVRFLQENNCYIDIIPGVSSIITALTISAMPTDKFMFCGFLPKTVIAKEKFLQSLYGSNFTLIFFESIKRLVSSLVAIAKIFGNVEICIARELTKIYQEVQRSTVKELIAYYSNKSVKGEIVLLVYPVSKKIDNIVKSLVEQEIDKFIRQSFSVEDSVNLVFNQNKQYYTRSEIYKMAIKIKKNLVK